MADNLSSYTVVCQGGLDTTENHLFLDANAPGSASELINYEVGLYGGYKRIDGYEIYDEDFPEVDPTGAEGKILGIFIFKETIIVARKQQSGDTYNYYYYAGVSGWIPYTLGFTLSSADVIKIRHALVTFGSDQYIAFVDGVNNLVIYDGTDWYKADSTGAGTSVDPGGNQMIDAPSYIETYRNTVFIAGDPTYPGIVVNSAPEGIFDWTTASGAGQQLSGFPVVQLKTFRDNLYVFGKQDLRYTTLDGDVFVMKDVAKNIGCIASDSVIELNGDVLFMAQDGVRTISGTAKIGDVNLASISKQIQRLINDIQDEYDLKYLDSVVIKKKSQFRYFVSEATETSIGAGIIGGLRGSLDSSSMEYSELQGVRVSCVVSGYISNREIILHGDYDGKVYQQESGNTFNGDSVYSLYSTPYLTFGDFLTRKELRELHVFTQYTGAFVLAAKLKFDWDNPNSLSPNTFSGTILRGDVPMYDDGETYDSGVLYPSENSYPLIDYDISGTCKSVKISFTTNGDNYPHTIQGFIYEFTPQGKR